MVKETFERVGGRGMFQKGGGRGTFERVEEGEYLKGWRKGDI